MGFWDKLLGKEKGQRGPEPVKTAEPAPQDDGMREWAAVHARDMDRRLEQLQAAERPAAAAFEYKNVEVDPVLEREAQLEKKVAHYLKDVVPQAKLGEEKAIRAMQVPDDVLQSEWMNLVNIGNKPSYETWKEARRERVIQALGSAEEYYAIVRHVQGAFEQAGKNPQKAMEAIVRQYNELTRQISEMQQRGEPADHIAFMEIKAKRLYAAASKLHELIQTP